MRTAAATLPLLALLIIGCTDKPCETSTECDSGQVCASRRCQSLACDAIYHAVDPASSQCRPLPACGNKDEVRGWTSCEDPCAGVGEHACIADPRCQPGYVTDQTVSTLGAIEPCFSGQGSPTSGGGLRPESERLCGVSGPRTFSGCRANPMPVDPCRGLGTSACKADPRCVANEIGRPGPLCDCAPGADCTCNGGLPPLGECRVKDCVDYTAQECAAHPECDSTQAGFGMGSCFRRSGGACHGLDEKSCLGRADCHPVGESCYCPPNATCVCGGGAFLFCEADDGLHRCLADADCGGDERCSNDESCAPAIGLGGFDATAAETRCAGLCVPKGCRGFGSEKCNADPTCHPIYTLNCTPYGGGNFPGGFGGCGGFDGAPPPNGGAGTSLSCDSSCEPTFSRCVEAVPGPVVDDDKSVLLRQPEVVDAPSFAFSAVMSKLAGGGDPAPFVTAWLRQLTTDVTVAGKRAPARRGFTTYFNALPRRADGLIDVGKLDLQVTSLSNRIDLAGPTDCGEARITYALKGGVTDRRNRLTIIVELRQPDDGAQCTTVARRWVALSQLDGVALRDAAVAIYAPLTAPATLNQVRTNEFLVGPPTFSADPALENEPWELREFRLGAGGQLELALSKQAVDPALSLEAPFRAWAADNYAAIVAGTAVVPDTYLAVISSENGQRLNVGTGEEDAALNLMACAGCHTTETNTAFAHVAERHNGSGRAQISEMLRQALPGRGLNLYQVSLGGLKKSSRTALKRVH